MEALWSPSIQGALWSPYQKQSVQSPYGLHEAPLERSFAMGVFTKPLYKKGSAKAPIERGFTKHL